MRLWVAVQFIMWDMDGTVSWTSSLYIIIIITTITTTTTTTTVTLLIFHICLTNWCATGPLLTLRGACLLAKRTRKRPKVTIQYSNREMTFHLNAMESISYMIMKIMMYSYLLLLLLLMLISGKRTWLVPRR